MTVFCCASVTRLLGVKKFILEENNNNTDDPKTHSVKRVFRRHNLRGFSAITFKTIDVEVAESFTQY